MIAPPQKGEGDDNVTGARARHDKDAGSVTHHGLVPAGALRQLSSLSGIRWGPREPSRGGRKIEQHPGDGQTVVNTKKQSVTRTAAPHRDSVVHLRNKPLRDLTGDALRTYFRDLNGHKPNALYELVLGEVEPPLFEAVLDYTGGNQSRAAQILGLNRATLRKKLKQYELLG